MRRMIVGSIVLAALATPVAAHKGLKHQGCDPAATFSAGALTVSGAFTRAMLPNAPTAGGYLTIANGGDAPDILLGAQSEAAGTIQLHSMSMDGDVMKMARVAGGIEIPAGHSVSLTPDGSHMMFMGIPIAFKEGECVEVTLHFAKAGDLPVVLPIGGVAAEAPPGTATDMRMDHDMTTDRK